MNGPAAHPRITVDCSPLLVRSAGVKTWLYHWVKGLARLAPGRVRTVLGVAGDELKHEQRLSANFSLLALLALVNASGGMLSELLTRRCDIFHASNLLRYPPRSPLLSATVHDLTSWLLPEMHTRATVLADRHFAKAVLARAAGMIAVSENSKQDAVRLLGLAPERIRVVYPGVADAYFAAGAASAGDALRPPSRFLFVGTLEPRKNVETLIDAWISLPISFRREFELCIAGMDGWHSAQVARRIAALSREGAGIRRMGYVPESELPGLIAGSCALVYPSLYEGFGIPIAQAMAAGCPVIASGVSSIPEVVGDAGVLVDPRSPADIAQAIRRISDSPLARAKLIGLGRERAQMFTWQKACGDSLEFFSALAGGGPR